MRKSWWIIPLLFTAIGAPLVHADTFNFTITGPITGSGTFTTDPLSGGNYLVTGITGTYAGDPITALTPPSPAPNSFDGNDNLIHAATMTPDGFGISFLYDASDVNLFDESHPTMPGDQIATQDLSQLRDGAFTPVTLSMVATPEPNSVFLMSAALLAVALVARKHNAQPRGVYARSVGQSSHR